MVMAPSALQRAKLPPCHNWMLTKNVPIPRILQLLERVSSNLSFAHSARPNKSAFASEPRGLHILKLWVLRMPMLRQPTTKQLCRRRPKAGPPCRGSGSFAPFRAQHGHLGERLVMAFALAGLCVPHISGAPFFAQLVCARRQHATLRSGNADASRKPLSRSSGQLSPYQFE